MNNDQQHMPPEMLDRIIIDKQFKISHYEQLLQMTCNQQNIHLIRNMLRDERRHLSEFVELYYKLFDRQPKLLDLSAPKIDTFVGGIQYLFLMEANTFVFYHEVYYHFPHTKVRDIFRRAFVDENLHIPQLNHVLISSLLENKQV